MNDQAETMIGAPPIKGPGHGGPGGPGSGGASGRVGHLTSAAGPILSMLFVLRKTRDLDALRDLPNTVLQQVEGFRRAARDLGASPGDVDDATYAVAATFDEAMLTRDWQGKSVWQAQSLAQRYCNNEFVGLGFYDKLAQIRRSVPARPDVVEIYYYCMASGFKGKLIDNPKEHADLIDELSREIAPPAAELAPAAYAEKARLAPLRRFPWIAVILTCIALPFLVWLVSWEVLDGRAESIVQALRSYKF